MKAIRVLFLALALIMASAASAQSVYNSSGSRCGTIENNGTIRNSSGASVGKFDSNGTFRNSSGASIGRAQYIPREWVAAYFFFFPFY